MSRDTQVYLEKWHYKRSERAQETIPGWVESICVLSDDHLAVLHASRKVLLNQTFHLPLL
jgi:hypothetical protein